MKPDEKRSQFRRVANPLAPELALFSASLAEGFDILPDQPFRSGLAEVRQADHARIFSCGTGETLLCTGGVSPDDRVMSFCEEWLLMEQRIAGAADSRSHSA